MNTKHLCMLEAHRGVSTEAPMNTMAAFRLAKEQGYGMIELDTKFTKDDRCVILHDRTVNNTGRHADGTPIAEKTEIASLTFDEARALDFGIAFGEQFRGETLPALEEVLDFAVENRIPLKFDNVLQSHTEAQLKIFFDAIDEKNALPWVGFTSNSVEFIKKIIARFPDAAIHYDGPSDEETLKTLSSLISRDRLTVWVRYDNAATAWNTTPPATEESCAMVRKYARLGLWLLSAEEEYRTARDVFQADLAETNGQLKPDTIAIRLYGANDLRLEHFALPEIADDEVLLHVVTDTLCASTYKAVKQGSGHKRVPKNVAEHPIIIGHEMCGDIVRVGKDLTDEWHVGDKIIIQPALKLENLYDPGYSYEYIGGNATYAVVPRVVLDRHCMIPYQGESYFKGSLVESIGCMLRGFKGMYHINDIDGARLDGIREGGKTAILGGAGPMGLAAAELAVAYGHASVVVVTDINEKRLRDAERRYSPEKAAAHGCTLRYVNTSGIEDVTAYLRNLIGGGFDDVFVMVPFSPLFTMAEQIAGIDGCVNFFAGPADHGLVGSLNLYRIHYDGVHVVGTAGSTTGDTRDTIRLIEEKRIDPGIMVSHIMGLGAVKDAIFAMEHPSGAKKVCYTGLDLPCIALSEFAERGKTDPMFAELDRLVTANGGLWSAEAEEYLLKHAPRITEAQTEN